MKLSVQGEGAPIRLIDDARLDTYNIADDGFTGLVTGVTGSGKTLALRKLIEKLGAENVLVIATDPRLAPLDGLGARVLKAWLPSSATGAELKAAAQDAWARIASFHKDLTMAANNPKIVVPRVIVHDNISNTGDIIAARVAPADGWPTMPQWGTIGLDILNMVKFYRGLQIRGLIRIINCTTGFDKDAVDNMGRRVPVLQIGTGGQLAPKHISRYVDYQFHVTATYEPNNADRSTDGMFRRFQTCEMDGVIAKGSPKLPAPYMKACWWEVYKLTFGMDDNGKPIAA